MFFHSLPDLDRFNRLFQSSHFLRSFPKEADEGDFFICKIEKEFMFFVLSNNGIDVVFKMPMDRFENKFLIIVNPISSGATLTIEKYFYADQPDLEEKVDNFIAYGLKNSTGWLCIGIRNFIKETLPRIEKESKKIPGQPVKPTTTKSDAVIIREFVKHPNRSRRVRTIDEIISFHDKPQTR